MCRNDACTKDTCLYRYKTVGSNLLVRDQASGTYEPLHRNDPWDHPPSTLPGDRGRERSERPRPTNRDHSIAAGEATAEHATEHAKQCQCEACKYAHPACKSMTCMQMHKYTPKCNKHAESHRKIAKGHAKRNWHAMSMQKRNWHANAIITLDPEQSERTTALMH